MQTQGGAPAAVAIERTGGKRYFRKEVLVDWNRNGLFDHELSDITDLVDEITVERSLSGSAPAEIMLVEGFAAAQLSITLDGEYQGLPVVAVFSTYNGFSPLYTVDQQGCLITYRIGVDTSVGTVWYNQFVGKIRTSYPKRSTGKVTLTALDRAEDMRQPVTFPIWATGSYMAMRGWEEAQLMDSQWAVDHCLRTADVSPTPYRPLLNGETFFANNQFWLSGNGSWVPNIGYIDSIRIQGFPKSEGTGADLYVQEGTPHPSVATEAIATSRRPVHLGAMGSDATGYRPTVEANHPSDKRQQSNFKQYRAANTEVMSIFGTNWFGFTLITHGPNGTWWSTQNTDVLAIRLGAQMVAKIQINAGIARVRFENIETGTTANGPSLTLPTGQDSVQIDARLQVRTTDVCRMHLLVNSANGGFGQTTFTSYDGTTPEDNQQGLVILNHQVGLQDVYWTQRFISITSDLTESQIQDNARKPAAHGAILDRGLNRLTVTPTRSYEDAWAVVSSVAAAEYASVFFDESGVFRLWTRDTLLSKQATAVRTLTLDDTEDLGNQTSADSVRNIVTADTVVATSDVARTFEASEVDQFVILAGQTIRFRIRVDDMVSITPWKVPRYASVADVNVPLAWTDAISFGYVVQFETSPGVWVEQNNKVSGVDITAAIDLDYNLAIRVFNGYTINARFATDGGSPALRLSGTKVFKQENIQVQVRDQSSINKYGPRNLPIGGDWVQQQPAVVTNLVDYTLDRSTIPIPTTDELPILGDPRLQIGDCVDVADPNGIGELIKLQLLGYKRTLSRDSGLTDRLTVELIRPALVGIWDSAQYGRWDETFIWSA